MRKPAVALAVLAALAVIIFSIRLVPSLSSRRIPVETLIRESAKQAAGRNASVAQEALETEQDQGNERSAIEAPPAQSESGFNLVRALWVEGRVLFPDSVPDDPDLVMLALRRALAPNELYGSNGAASADQPDPTELLSLRDIEADGRFRVPFPEDSQAGWLSVAGRYLFSERCTRVDLSGDRAPLILEAEGGGWITGQVILDAVQGPATEQFASTKIVLAPDSSQPREATGLTAWAFPRTAAVDASGRFEFRAVRADRRYQIEVTAAGFAPWLRQGIQPEPGTREQVEITLSRGARVRGRVLDVDSNPVAEARIRATRTAVQGLSVSVVVGTTSDAAGDFVLVDLPSGYAEIIASKEGYRTSRPLEVELQAGETVADLVLTLERGEMLSGIVSWPDGRRAVEARVDVSVDPEVAGAPGSHFAGRTETQAWTDEQGRFEVRGLAEGPFLVRAEAREPAMDEDWSASLGGVGANTRDLELVLAPPGAIQGNVVDPDGEPVDNFLVVSQPKGTLAASGTGARRDPFTDENGHFVLTDLEPGTWELMVQASEHAPSKAVPVELPRPDGSETLLFRLEPAARVSGIVVDSNGKGIPRATVTALLVSLSEDSPTGEVGWAVKAVTDESGAFGYGNLPGGSVSLEAGHGGYASSEPLAVDVPGGSFVEDVVLTLYAGGTLTGQAFGQDGEPMDGAEVLIQNPPTQDNFTLRADAKGRFRKEHLLAGPWQVTVMKGALDPNREDGLSQFMQNVLYAVAQIEDGETTHVVLGEPSAEAVAVHGRVTHASEPAAGMTLLFLHEGAAGMKFAATDSGGAYEVRLDSPGDYFIEVRSSLGGPELSSVTFHKSIPASERHRLDFALPVGSISGTVFGPEGEPLAGTRVSLTSGEGRQSGTLTSGRHETLTDARGDYHFEFLEAGPYSAAAGGPSFGAPMLASSDVGRVARTGLSLLEGQRLTGVDFQLQESGDIAGIILAAGGVPVRGASVFVRDANGHLLEHLLLNSTGPDGRFHVRGVAPGNYTLFARTSALATAKPPGVKVRSGEASKMDVTLTSATLLRIRVVDSSGRPIPVHISVTDRRGHEFAGMLTYADVMGRFSAGEGTLEQRIGPLPASAYDVVATSAEGRSVRRRVTLGEDAEHVLELRIP